MAQAAVGTEDMMLRRALKGKQRRQMCRATCPCDGTKFTASSDSPRALLLTRGVGAVSTGRYGSELASVRRAPANVMLAPKDSGGA